MTVQLIRRTAKDIAGAFYEKERTPMFRRAFPTPEDFIHGRAHRRDGRIELQNPNWWQFVDAAKETLARMLADKSVSEHMKERIKEQLIEHAMRGSKAGARRVVQANLEKRDEQPKEHTEIAQVRI
jgi:hypothetical protein